MCVSEAPRSPCVTACQNAIVASEEGELNGGEVHLGQVEHLGCMAEQADFQDLPTEAALTEDD